MISEYVLRAFPVQVNHHYYVFQDKSGNPKRICKFNSDKRVNLKKIPFVDLIAQLTKDIESRKSTMSRTELEGLKDIVTTMRKNKAKKIETKSKCKEVFRKFFSQIQNKLKGYERVTSDTMAENLSTQINEILKTKPVTQQIPLAPLPTVPSNKQERNAELDKMIEEATKLYNSVDAEKLVILKHIIDSGSSDYSKLKEMSKNFGSLMHSLSTALTLVEESYFTSEKIENWRLWFTILIKDFGLDINQQKDNGRTPLYNLLGNRSSHIPYQIVETFLQLGADPSIKTKVEEETFFQVGVGKQTKPKYHVGHDVLWGATCCETKLDSKIVNLLAQRGGDVNAKDQHGKSLLHWVSYHHGSAGIVAALLKNGANPNAHTKHDGTPLTFGFKKNDPRDPEVLKTLIRYRADIYAMESGSHTAMAHAAWFGETINLQTLLDLGVDPIENDNHAKETALHYAAMNTVDIDKLAPLITKETVKAGNHIGENFLHTYSIQNVTTAESQVKQILQRASVSPKPAKL